MPLMETTRMANSRNPKGGADHGANKQNTQGPHDSGIKKDRKGDTGRTSNQGQKEASGGSTNTNNRGHKKDDTIGNP